MLSVRRDTGEKAPVELSRLKEETGTILEARQQNLLTRNRLFREKHTFEIGSLREPREMFSSEGGAGFAVCSHCGSRACDQSIKDELGVTNGCFPFDIAESRRGRLEYLACPAEIVIRSAKLIDGLYAQVSVPARWNSWAVSVLVSCGAGC